MAWFDAVPAHLATPFTLGASIVAAAGSALVLWGTVYGAWAPALWAVGVFAVAAVLWHLADHASGR